MSRRSAEWLKQSDYDMDTAEFLFNGERYFYAVFMCHLSIEKALKALYTKRFNDSPPRTHNLLYLIERIGLELTDDLYDLVFTINRASVPTRYPDNLERILQDYSKQRVEEILKKSKVILDWLKAELQMLSSS